MALGVHLPLPSHQFDCDFEFDFGHGGANATLSTPSSPTRFGGGFFFSTPPTPARGSEIYGEFQDFTIDAAEHSKNRFETIRTPLIYQQQQQQSPARKSSQRKSSFMSNNLWNAISNKKSSKLPAVELQPERSGRDYQRDSSSSNLESGKREARSVSPERRKWRLKDLLLFRSKSEGHSHQESHKDPFKKYSKIGSNTRISSGSQLIDQQNFSGGKRGAATVSAHELHYKTNKAISEDMKKKSFLPYKQGILGRLAINPTAQGFGSLAHTRTRG